MNETKIFATAAERLAAIKKLAAAVADMERAAALVNNAKDEVLNAGLRDAHERCRVAYNAYQDGLPRPALSRCPFTGAIVHLAIDSFGLDGPWWNYEVPARPGDDLPATVFAVTGAVNIKGNFSKLTHLCKPGPAVPYVVPRLLVDPRVKAVVSTLKVGRYDAYPVIYYAEDTPHELARVNRWGTDHYAAEMPHGEGYTVTVPDMAPDFDCDLEFYIRTGRLQWIMPGDAGLTLRGTTGQCPYLGLEGRRYPVAMQDGKMWSNLVDMTVADAAGAEIHRDTNEQGGRP